MVSFNRSFRTYLSPCTLPEAAFLVGILKPFIDDASSYAKFLRSLKGLDRKIFDVTSDSAVRNPVWGNHVDDLIKRIYSGLYTLTHSSEFNQNKSFPRSCGISQYYDLRLRAVESRLRGLNISIQRLARELDSLRDGWGDELKTFCDVESAEARVYVSPPAFQHPFVWLMNNYLDQLSLGRQVECLNLLTQFFKDSTEVVESVTNFYQNLSGVFNQKPLVFEGGIDSCFRNPNTQLTLRFNLCCVDEKSEFYGWLQNVRGHDFNFRPLVDGRYECGESQLKVNFTFKEFLEVMLGSYSPSVAADLLRGWTNFDAQVFEEFEDLISWISNAYSNCVVLTHEVGSARTSRVFCKNPPFPEDLGDLLEAPSSWRSMSMYKTGVVFGPLRGGIRGEAVRNKIYEQVNDWECGGRPLVVVVSSYWPVVKGRLPDLGCDNVNIYRTNVIELEDVLF